MINYDLNPQQGHDIGKEVSCLDLMFFVAYYLCQVMSLWNRSEVYPGVLVGPYIAWLLHSSSTRSNFDRG